MAVEYDFYLGAPATEIRTAEELARAGSTIFDPTVTNIAQSLINSGVDSQQGLWARVLVPSLPPWGHPVVTDLGFTPTARVAYRLDKSQDLRHQTDTMIQLTGALLANLPGDAALTWELEVVWLLRKDHELALNERDDIWTPRRLDLIPIPYRRATYSFSDK